MDSSESSSKVIMSNKQLSNSVPQKQGDSDYDDDFEDADSNIREASKDSSSPTSSPKVSGRKDVFHSGSEESDAQPEKGQREASGQAPTEKSVQPGDNSAHGKRQTSPHEESQSDESEPEPEGDVLFTDDLQRAMRELVDQKHDSGIYSEDPPEYNVKERLKELNAELASEPDPDNRQHRVGFKPELVDLVAPPPPEVSDDEETPRKDKENRDAGDRDTSKGHVIVRSGKFEYVGEHELTADERYMLNLPDEDVNANKNQQKHGNGDHQNQSERHSRQPAPPSKPRPSTANSSSRRNVHPATSQRPKTASQTRSNESSSMLQNFDYKSRYAMSPSEKKKAQEQARLREEQRKKEEEKKKKEEEEKQQEAHECFVFWLKRKQEEKKKEKEKDEQRKKKEAQEDKTDSNGYPNFPYLEPFEPIFQLKSQENEQAFHEWLKTKHNQHKKEKLLKKREEQEINDGYYVRSREECDKAYKEWLKKKYAELNEKKKAEKQKNKSYKIQARRARKQMMMARAVRQSQAFRYVDYYGYRF